MTDTPRGLAEGMIAAWGAQMMAGADARLVAEMAELDPQHAHGAERFAELALELHDAHSLADTAETVADFAVQAVGCQYAGIALAVRGGRFEIGATTDSVVDSLYEVQSHSGEGPLLTALDSGLTIAVHDATSETRWPGWQNRAADLGIGSVLHVPMRSQDRTIGVLSLYNRKPNAFDLDDEAIAHILAQHASIAVATAVQDETMAQAIDARRLIGQAMGILMERFDVDDDRAFAILRRYSQDTNTKLRDVAQHLIDTRLLPPTP
jgi:GAF domain-containing protein